MSSIRILEGYGKIIGENWQGIIEHLNLAVCKLCMFCLSDKTSEQALDAVLSLVDNFGINLRTLLVILSSSKKL